MSADKVFIGHLRSSFRKNIENHNLISKGDKVLCAISGGKDSMALLHLLAFYRKYFMTDFCLSAVYIHVENAAYSIDRNAVELFCKNLGVEFIYRNIVLKDERGGENRCFICSTARRSALFNLTKELGFNVLALGHNADDAVETLMMNMFFHSSICSLPYSLDMFDGRLRLIRPLLSINKNQTRKYSQIYDFPTIKTACGFEIATSRGMIRSLLDKLTEKNKDIPTNIFRSMSDIKNDYLPFIK